MCNQGINNKMSDDHARRTLHSGRGRLRPALLQGSALALLALAALASAPLRAQSVFNPYVSAEVEHNSNLFALPSYSAQLPAGYDTAVADTLQKYIIGLDSHYQFGRQQLEIGLEGRRLNYNNFSRLDHYESLITAALKWQLAAMLDGDLDYRREQRIAPFTERVSESLTIEHESNAKAQANLQFTPDWRLEGILKWRDWESPQPGLADYGLREHSEGLGLLYTAISNLSFGVVGEYLTGTYHGTNEAPDYNQTTAGLAAEYKLGGRTSLSATGGYTRREQPGTNQNTSAFTGSFHYKRQLTGKTRVGLQIDRAVNTYITAGNTEVDTGVTVNAQWEATYKIIVSLDASRVHSTFQAINILDPTVNGRVDTTRGGGIDIEYKALSWLSMHAYDRYQKRDSNVVLYSFTGNVVGFEIRGRFGPGVY